MKIYGSLPNLNELDVPPQNLFYTSSFYLTGIEYPQRSSMLKQSARWKKTTVKMQKQEVVIRYKYWSTKILILWKQGVLTKIRPFKLIDMYKYLQVSVLSVNFVLNFTMWHLFMTRLERYFSFIYLYVFITYNYRANCWWVVIWSVTSTSACMLNSNARRK